MISLILGVFLCLQDKLPQPQEPPKPVEEKLTFQVPSFYASMVASIPDNPVALGENLEILPPKPGITRRYFFQTVGEIGVIIGHEEINAGKLAASIQTILNYGVRDSLTAFSKESYINPGFSELVKDLVKKGVVSEKWLRDVIAKRYADHHWYESLYWLDEALPGVLREKVQGLDNIAPNTNFPEYFTALVAIKLDQGDQKMIGEGYKRINEHLNRLSANNAGARFPYFIVAVSHLHRKSKEVPKDTQINLMRCALDFSATLTPQALRDQYQLSNLPFPEKEVIGQVLLAKINSAERPTSRIIGYYRVFEIDFPKEKAGEYLTWALDNFGESASEDVIYLSAILGDQAVAPESWKRYGDSAWSWHRSKENRKLQKDHGDYFHAAAESYRRLSPFTAKLEDEYKELAKKRDRNAEEAKKLEELARRIGRLKLSPAKLEAMLKETDDLSVRMADLITIHELTGRNWKNEWQIERLEARCEKYRALPTGYCYDESGSIGFSKSEYWQWLTPFRDDIELASALKEGSRIRELSRKIGAWASDQMRKEGQTLRRIFAADLSLEQRLGSNWSPVFANLELITDLYAELQFTDGARSLAQHIYSEGFILPACRLFKLGGLEKVANEKVYSKFTAEELQKKQEELNLILRKQK